MLSLIFGKKVTAFEISFEASTGPPREGLPFPVVSTLAGNNGVF